MHCQSSRRHLCIRGLLLLLLVGAGLDTLAQRIHFPPIIITHPRNQTVLEGASVTFTVEAKSADPLTYQWRFNGTNLVGATIATLTLRNVTNSNAGEYTVLVQNVGGTKLSNVAHLKVNASGANDAFAGRTLLAGTNVTVKGNNLRATKEPGESNHGGYSGGKSVWWTWTAPVSGRVTIHTVGSNFDTLLGVYTGVEVSALRFVAGDNDSGGLGLSQVTFEAIEGTPYEIAVDSYSGQSGEIVLSVLGTSPPHIIITSPAPGTIFGAGVDIPLSATAGDDDGQFVQVEFFADGAALGDVITNTPFALVWTNAPAGSHVLRALATDETGAVAVAEVPITAQGVPPANDNFANRVPITDTNQVTGANFLATREPGEPNHGASSGRSSVWWSWTAPSTGRITITTSGSDFDTLLGVYTGFSIAALTLIANNDDSGVNGASQVSFQALINTAYQLAVEGYAGQEGNIVLSLLPTAPPAIIITIPAPNALVLLSSQDATTDLLVEVEANDEDGSVRQVELTLTGPQTLLSASVTNPPFSVLFTNRAAGEYFLAAIATDNAGASSVTNSTFRLSGPPPANDDFANSLEISGTNATVNGSNQAATVEPGEPNHADGFTQHSVWWHWAAPESGRFVITTEGSDFDTVLAVYSGTNVQRLTLVGSNDESGRGPTSAVIISAEATRTYQIAVGGFYRATGNITLSLNGPMGLSPNDDFETRLPIAGQSATITGNNFGATAQPGEPPHAGSGARHSVWWSWTAPEAGGVNLALSAASFLGSRLAVYTSTNLLELVPVASLKASGNNVSFAVTAGTEYQIAVDGGETEAGTLSFTLNTVQTPTLILEQPQNLSVLAGRDGTLAVGTAGIPPLSYQWQLNGADLPGATQPLLVLASLAPHQSGNYTVIITNTFNSVTSKVAVVAVTADLTSPAVLAARTYGHPTEVRLTFAEPVAPATALVATNFVIDNGITVFEAIGDPLDPTVVVLVTSPLQPGQSYLLSVRGVTDLAGNSVTANPQTPLDLEPAPFREFGEEVNGFQDDFPGNARDFRWLPQGAGGDVYSQTNGILSVHSAEGTANHLVLAANGYDPTVQEVLARLRVVRLGQGDAPRAGVSVVVDSESSQGIDLNLRTEEAAGQQMRLLDERSARGPAFNFGWQINTWYWLRLRHEPNAGGSELDVFAKFWPADGVAAEPHRWQTWNYTPNDQGLTLPPRSGLAGIAAGTAAGLAEFDVDYILIKAAGLPRIRVTPQAFPPLPRLSAVQTLGATGIQFTVSGGAGRDVVVEASPDLSTWTPLTTLTNLNSLRLFLDLNATQAGQRFYRAVVK